MRALASPELFSEGGPTVGGRLIALRVADEVALFTSFKPLGRAGLPALSSESWAALAAPSRYRPLQRALCGRDQYDLYLSEDFG